MLIKRPRTVRELSSDMEIHRDAAYRLIKLFRSEGLVYASAYTDKGAAIWAWQPSVCERPDAVRRA